MESLVIIALAFTIPFATAAVRPTRALLALLLAIGLGYVTVMLVRDDLHPTQADDLAWTGIVYGVMSALIVGGWFVGRAARRRARPVGARPV